MATWRMEAVGDLVTLTYFTVGKLPEKCGTIRRDCEDDLTAWVLDEMAPWDACTLPSGVTFICQVTRCGVRA